MKTYEVESVEGIGYLLFERTDENRTRRIGEIFQNMRQARSYIGNSNATIKLLYPNTYDEMINTDEDMKHATAS